MPRGVRVQVPPSALFTSGCHAPCHSPRQGYIADIVIFDPQTINRGEEKYVQDVPGDGSRYVRDAMGVDTVIVGGGVAWTAVAGYNADTRGEILPGQVQDTRTLVPA